MSSDSYWREVIDPGDRASKLAHAVCMGSFKNSSLVHVVPHQPGNFRGPVGFLWRRDLIQRLSDYSIDGQGNVTRWELMEALENDGAGGKPQFFTLLGDTEVFRGLGWELICMVAEDFWRTGRRPVVFLNQVDAKQISEHNFHLFEALMRGYGEALSSVGCVNLTGETAIMQDSITAFCDTGDPNQMILTWSGACVGLTDHNLLVDGTKIRPKMPIIGLHEKGYRCNGGGFFTKLIRQRWGLDREVLCGSPEVREFVRKLVVPSVSYSNLLAQVTGWEYIPPAIERPVVHGMAHITGGGVWGKLGDLLPEGIGADLHSMPAPPQVLLEAQQMSFGMQNHLSDWHAYSTFHGGCGMLIVCGEGSEGSILELASNHGIGATVVGETFASQSREILVTSRFSSDGMRLSSLSPY